MDRRDDPGDRATPLSGTQLTPPGDYAVFEQLRRVIAWEVEAQAGVDRPMRDMPSLIADTLLDYFVVTLKADVDLP